MHARGMRRLGSKRIASVAIGVGLLAAALAMPAASAQGLECNTLGSRDTCRFLEENILDYYSDVPVAGYTGDADRIELPPAPNGVGQRFWEENVWIYGNGIATFEGDEDPQSLLPGPDDVEQHGLGVVNY